ncbi:hypothetical protein ABMA28_009378 [Loxostege sticticalis]|uniref:DUF4371 domain-containing protein n=1 Tax=Loxostege sticticalis TaxID=481309 RepID=A0ABD0SD49_LOXSC
MCKVELKNIYMPTRWNSTLHMISRFVELLAAVKSTAGEVLLASFVAEHNLSTNNLRVGSRTKTTAIIKSVTGDTEKENLIADLKIRKFLLLIDKSTGRGCVKLLRIVFRYYRNKKIKDAFFALIPVQDATGEKLYEHLVKLFTDNDIPYKDNLVEFAADGANAMMGQHNSVASRLLEDILHLYVVKCICHSFALCASYACTKLPREPEGLVRDVYNYISTSPKRTGLLKEFQQFLTLKPHKILHPCQTRWLSLRSAVVRILEQYEALKLLFIDANLDGRKILWRSRNE